MDKCQEWCRYSIHQQPAKQLIDFVEPAASILTSVYPFILSRTCLFLWLSTLQLQSSFGPDERLSRNRELSIKPKEDVTVHLLFAPTRVASMLAKLEIKQSAARASQPGVKFTVSLLLIPHKPQYCCKKLVLHFSVVFSDPSVRLWRHE